MALVQRRPLVVHDTDDELQMARRCAAIWPCRKTAAHPLPRQLSFSFMETGERNGEAR